MNDRELFLKALKENEDDNALRLVYADWLEEHGEVEEAQRQRAWSGAKAWLKDLCEREGERDSGDDYYPSFTYEETIMRARYALEAGHYSFHCGANQNFQDTLNSCREEFWRNVSIITGLPIDIEASGSDYFSCAC